MASKRKRGSGVLPASAFVVVLVTVPDAACGEKIARALVTERLAACVNRVGPLRSTFRWNGELDTAAEHLLVIKARASAFARLRARVERLHPYDVPEVIALPLVRGAEEYLRWLAAESDA